MILVSAVFYAATTLAGPSPAAIAQNEVGIVKQEANRLEPIFLAYQPPPPRPPRRPGPPRTPPPPSPPRPEGNVPRTDIYLFLAPGGVSERGNTLTAFQAGAGVEEVLRHGLGIGVEASAIGRSHDFGRSVSGLVSSNAYYHFLRSPRTKLDPFLTAGYSVLFRDDIRNAGNFGAGLNYWFRPHTGVRFEVRDQIVPDHPPIPGATARGTAQYWGVRVGLVF